MSVNRRLVLSALLAWIVLASVVYVFVLLVSGGAAGPVDGTPAAVHHEAPARD
jgi:hypothetical protein